MRYLGLDLGTKTLGTALSDQSKMISSPHKLIRFTKEEVALTEVLEIIKKYQISAIVLGFPKNMDNSIGFAAQRSIDFKNMLEKHTDVPIYLVDERLSTVEAENILLRANMKRSKRKKIIDQISASVILDTYLRKLGNNGNQ